jgi:uncharacterized protein DUF5919
MRIWRSLDLLLTLAVAVTVGTLGMFDVAGGPVLAGATLATLGVLALGSLTTRAQMRAVSTGLAGLAAPPTDRLLSASTSGADADLGAAHDIGIIGVTLSRTVRNQMTALQQCVRRGGTVRIAVIDPAGDVTAEAARRSTVPGSPDVFVHRLRPTLDLLARLAATPGPGRVEIRLLDFVPAFGLLAVDAAGPDGHLRVDVYSHRFGGREPALHLRAGRDPAWYPHFQAEFEQIWAAGRPALCQSDENANLGS